MIKRGGEVRELFLSNIPDGAGDEVFGCDGYLVNYTLLAPVKHCVYRRLCSSGKCSLLYSGADECIFRSSRLTAAGDEIGWLFVDQVTTTKCSFKSFCELMTNNYKRTCSDSKSFMDQKTFIHWWFSWTSGKHVNGV